MSDDSNNPEASTDADPEAYRVLAGSGRAETKVQGSRFLAFAEPVESEEEAELFVEGARSEHYDARHVCYGLRVGLGAARIDRSNDDGEPPRTGGFPLWQILSGEEIENALIYVVRYFGGTKLGMGGLTRAYREAGRKALADAGTRIHHPETTLTLTVPYSRFDEIQHIIDNLEGVRIQDRQFTAHIELSLAIWTSKTTKISARLANFLGCDPDEFL